MSSSSQGRIAGVLSVLSKALLLRNAELISMTEIKAQVVSLQSEATIVRSPSDDQLK